MTTNAIAPAIAGDFELGASGVSIVADQPGFCSNGTAQVMYGGSKDR
jgi:hypothetical protein